MIHLEYEWARNLALLIYCRAIIVLQHCNDYNCWLCKTSNRDHEIHEHSCPQTTTVTALLRRWLSIEWCEWTMVWMNTQPSLQCSYHWWADWPLRSSAVPGQSAVCYQPNTNTHSPVPHPPDAFDEPCVRLGQERVKKMRGGGRDRKSVV